MPNTTGIDFLSESRKICPKAFRLLITGYSDKDVPEKCVNIAKCWSYLKKPFDNNLLKETIENCAEEYVDLYLLPTIRSGT